jgi:hypothetical protein
MCPPRSSSTVGLKPPGGLDVEDKPSLALLSGPQENIKVADLFCLDNAADSNRKVCRRRASKDGWGCNAQTREAANLQGHLNHRRSLALKSFPQCLPKFIQGTDTGPRHSQALRQQYPVKIGPSNLEQVPDDWPWIANA